jgi:cystathionine beta-lyase
MTETFDFDQIIDRSNTSSLKWEKYRGRDILPMWVAESDFAIAPAIQQALIKRAQHPVFGYTDSSEHLIELVVARMQNRYGWEIDPAWLLFLPGVVGAMNCACRSNGEVGDSVYTPAVIYFNISMAPGLSSRVNQPVPMCLRDDRMIIDLDWLEQQPARPGQVMLFCNPQNPGGAVYRESELRRLADIAERQELIICSDEIHCDLILDPDKRHIPIASLNPQIEQRSITLMAPSKTFSLAGLGFSFAIVPNRKLYAGMLRARKSGDEWNRQQCEYLAANRDYLIAEINSIPGLHLGPVESTYLAWIDASALKLEDTAKFFEDAGVGMSPGHAFGSPGWMRLNFACPRSRVEQAVERIRTAVENLD